MKNKDVHFLIHEPDGEFNTVYLDVTVNDAEGLLMQTELLKLTVDFLKRIQMEDYDFTIWKEGDPL